MFALFYVAEVMFDSTNQYTGKIPFRESECVATRNPKRDAAENIE